MLFIGPMALGAEWTNASGHLVTAVTRPGAAWKEIGIWFGAPLMVAYGLVTFALGFRTIGRAFADLRGSADPGADDAASRIEVPVAWFVVGTAITGVVVVILGWIAFDIPLHYGALAVFLSFFLALVACRATGDTDITPIGAMGKIMQLTYGALIPQNYAANLMTASITAGASSESADLLNDLKSGYLLGAHPRRQFVAQFLGIFTGAVASTLCYYLIVPDAQALTGRAGSPPQFAAPSAQQWKAVAELFRVGIGNLHPLAREGHRDRPRGRARRSRSSSGSSRRPGHGSPRRPASGSGCSCRSPPPSRSSSARPSRGRTSASTRARPSASWSRSRRASSRARASWASSSRR